MFKQKIADTIQNNQQGQLAFFQQILYRFEAEEMKKSSDHDQSEEQFEDFLKNMIELKPLLLENYKALHNRNESLELKQKSQKISQLQKQCQQHQRRMMLIRVELSSFKQKTMQLLERSRKYQHMLFNIITKIKTYLKKRHIDVKTKIKYILDEDTGEIDIKKFEEFFSQSFNMLSSELQTTAEQKNPQTQLKMKLDELNKELDKVKTKNLEIAQKYQSTVTEVQALKQMSAQLQKKLAHYQEEQQKYQELIRDLDIKTKNRSEVILLFKGLSKKQRQHENRCPLYDEENKLSAKELLKYEEDRKNYFAEKKKSLDNVLNFL